jgi:hypothetical protein
MTAEESRAVLSVEVARLSKRLVNDIVVGIFQRAGTPLVCSDDHVAELRVLCGLAMSEAAMIGAQYGARRAAPKVPNRTPKVPMPAPAATSATPVSFDDATTELTRRRPDHGDE